MPVFEMRVHKRWADVPELWRALAAGGAATPFQTPTFLAAWYEAFAAPALAPALAPVIVEALRAGDPAALFALVADGRALRFPDGGVSDQGAPVLGPAAPASPAEWRELFDEMRGALPDAWLLDLRRLPADLLPGALPSRDAAHPITLPERLADHEAALGARFAKEQRRKRRMLERFGEVRFEPATTPAGAHAVLEELDAYQATRFSDDPHFRLGDPRVRAFYTRLVELGFDAGAILAGRLTAGSEAVAAVLGVADRRTVAFVRLGFRDGPWAAASPGLIALDEAIRAAHARGWRRVDLSIGDHAYKLHFGARRQPLADLVAPLRWPGWPNVAADRIGRALRRSPAAVRLVRRLRAASL
jgi:CelD/BcsL family acetyltransferase involved in cellulose biosynthesis